ncbi:MAG: nucleotidyltransferase family protein [Clostridia bacterium]|nr:nucleotidyltransferase family protein [Clostridia bacterium]
MSFHNNISIGCVILAAGNSARFGENKLLAKIDGKTMIEHALEAIPGEKLSCVAVVTQYESIAKLADSFGFEYIINEHPELGLSHSVKLGTQALKGKCDGIIYQVSDQPWLKRESVSQMLDFFCDNPNSIISMSSNGRRGNPCIFPKAYFKELCSLSGDRGGRSVIELHEDNLLLFDVPETELIDVDKPEQLHSPLSKLHTYNTLHS